jgi:RHS repeat-associated protein
MCDTNTPNTSIREISIIQESNGKEYLCFEEIIKELGDSREFHNRWHSLKIIADYSNERVSIFLDGLPVFECLSMSHGYIFTPAVSMSTTPCDTTDVEIDDFTVHVFNSIDSENHFITIFTEDFERFEEGRFPENSGWICKEIKNKKKGHTTYSEAVSVSYDSISGLKSLKINPIEDDKVIIVKHFNIPGNFPFDISDKTLSIVYNKDMEELNSHETGLSRHKTKSLVKNSTPSTLASTSALAFENKNPHGPNTGCYFSGISAASVIGTIQSTTTVDTYYIYSFDGKLMAEYDHDGNCVKDYIYAGNRLIAEYQSQTGKYYYYMSDQINSTRIVTDDNGNVVYSEAYGPFGGIQKNWTKVYDLKLKFSGKEREAYGDLDYFGARYYDHSSYRFISVDPIINKKEALANPQLWNLYAYCRSNPISFMDPDGRQDFDWLADALAADYLDKNTDMSYKEYTQIIDQGRGFGALAGFVGLTGYFSPEIVAAAGPLAAKFGEKTIPAIKYKTLFENLSKGNIKHISKHLTEFRIFNSKMTLRNLCDLGHKIISNSKNLVSTAGGRGIYQSIEKIGGVKLTIRAITDTAGKLRSVNIRWDQLK